MGNFLYLRNAILKHSNGNSYPATNDITEQKFKYLPIAFVVKDGEFTSFQEIFRTNSLIVDKNGNYTNTYYSIKNVISDFFNMPLFGLWTSDDDGKLSILQSVFSNYNALTTYASGAYNNAIIVKNDYELYLDVAGHLTVQGTYKNGSSLSKFNRYGSIVGYASRSIIWIYNESLTKSFGVTMIPGYEGGSSFGMSYTYQEAITPDVVKEMLFNIAIQGDIPTDPYIDGGESGTGGGTGTFDGTGDNINFPSLPTVSSVDTGFISLYNPSIAQLKALANYLWGDAFDISTWKKIFADPMDAILGMSIVPVAVPDGPLTEVTVGNIGTGISMTKAGSQYVEIDCGTLSVKEYWGAYLDYDPYTKAEIYLPYIGIHPLSVDDIMNKSVHVKYHVDILSGSCCAYVKCGGSVMYSYVGQCSCSVPITGNDWTNVINGALSIAASIGTMVATGGASAPTAAATIASTAVNSMKPNVEKSGSMGGMGGMLGVQTPYLILTRPRQALPDRQNTFMGYPSFITMSLGDCSGYTEVESVHLENIPATEQELSEIENLLKGGVIF